MTGKISWHAAVVLVGVTIGVPCQVLSQEDELTVSLLHEFAVARGCRIAFAEFIERPGNSDVPYDILTYSISDRPAHASREFRALLQLWQLRPPSVLYAAEMEGGAWGLVFVSISADGKMIAAGDRELTFFDSKLRVIREVADLPSVIPRFSPRDRRVLAVSRYGGIVQSIRSDSGRVLASKAIINGITYDAAEIGFVGNGKTVVTVAPSHVDIRTFPELALERRTAFVGFRAVGLDSLHVLPDGKGFIIGGTDGEVLRMNRGSLRVEQRARVADDLIFLSKQALTLGPSRSAVAVLPASHRPAILLTDTLECKLKFGTPHNIGIRVHPKTNHILVWGPQGEGDDSRFRVQVWALRNKVHEKKKKPMSEAERGATTERTPKDGPLLVV